MAKYELTIELSALEDLGINLYSNVPAVLSEIVANAWDADAEEVRIAIDKPSRSITITDSGSGMSLDDLRNKYLTVGYKRREHGETSTPKFNRPVMGRKGIGKLALFSIAKEVKVYTSKVHDDGTIVKNSLKMDADEIRRHIKSNSGKAYEPLDLSDLYEENHGTKIVLTELKKDVRKLESDLKRRLSRRFSVIDGADNFTVYINDIQLTPDDRDYYKHVQYVWLIGPEGAKMRSLFKNAERINEIDGIVDDARGYYLDGWVGTFKEQSTIQEGDNTIAILARGKLIHEDILKNMKEGGIFTKYLVGDVRADFVDIDDNDDLATSDRQSLKEDDPRFIALKNYLQESVIKEIQKSWTKWRQDKASDDALENPKLKEWYDDLDGKDLKKAAKKMLGIVGSLYTEADDERKKEVYRYAMIAVERLAHEKSISAIESITNENDFLALSGLFNTLDSIEASMYYSIAKSRVGVLNKLRDLVEEDAKERVLQEHIFNHLWLLNPSWERATTNKRIEEKVDTAFKKVTSSLTKEEAAGRFDIRYRSSAGTHIIVELKRYSVKLNVHTLARQISKYRSALRKCLENEFGEINPNIQVVCILGADPGHPDGIEAAKGVLKNENAIYITYDRLISDSIESYQDYIAASERTDRIQQLIAAI